MPTHTLKKIVDAMKAPARKVWTYDLKTLFVDNPKAIEFLTFGLRTIPGVAPGHDHQQQGGELLRRTLLSLNFGPYIIENQLAAGGSSGIPLLFNAEYATYPKLLTTSLVTLPGGLSRLRGALLVASNGAAGEEVVLSPVLRGVHWHNFKLVANNLGVYATTNLTLTDDGASGVFLLEFALEATDLVRAKNAFADTRCEFAIYQSSNREMTDAQLLAVELWVDDDPTPTVPPPTAADPTSQNVTIADILTGKILLTALSRKIRGRLNSLITGVLGRAPGLAVDNLTPDTSFKWSRFIKNAHSHRGKLVPDPRGGFISDGVCLRYPRAYATWPRNWHESSSAGKPADTEQVLGLPIHSGIGLDASWLSWDFDIDLESGLGGLDLSVALSPSNTDDAAKLLIHVGVFTNEVNPVNLVNLVTDVRCDYHRREADDANGLAVCEVEPEENDAWVPNQNRRLAGKSVYSANAKLSANAASTLVDTTNAYRISKTISVYLSHPAYTLNGIARSTGRHILRVRFSLPTSGGNYDSQARILALEAVASRGY